MGKRTELRNMVIRRIKWGGRLLPALAGFMLPTALSLALLTLLVQPIVSPVDAAAGSGTVAVSGGPVIRSSAGNTLTFTFTAAETMNTGEVTVAAPTGWSAPQGTAGTAGYTVSSGTGDAVLDNADAISSWNAGTACTSGGVSVDTTVKQQGTGSIKCANGNEASGDVWYNNITAQDWSAYTHFRMWLRADVAVTAGHLQFSYDDSASLASPLESVSVGALSAATWTQVTIPFGTTTRTAVVSYGFRINNVSGLDNKTVWVDYIELLKVPRLAKVLDSADAISSWAAGTACATTAPAVDTTTKYEGTGSIKCVNGNEGSGDVWYNNITAQDWSAYTHVALYLQASGAVTAGHLQFSYDDSANLGTPLESISVGALAAGTWTRVVLNLGLTTRTSVVSYGFTINNANGMDGKTVWFDDLMAGPGTPTFSGQTISQRLFNMASTETITITYGSGGGTSGATAQSTAGYPTFTTQSRPDNTATLANLASQPTVIVKEAAAGTDFQSHTDSARSVPEEDLFSNSNNTVYMRMTSIDNQTFNVAYYDGTASPGPQKVKEESSILAASNILDSTTGALPTCCGSSIAGTWHSVVYPSTASAPATYNGSDSSIIADDTFTVQDTAIPELPTVLAAMAAGAAAALIYLWMRSRVRYVEA